MIAAQATHPFWEEMHPNGRKPPVKELEVWSCEAEAPVTPPGLVPRRQNLGVACAYIDK